MDGLFTWGSERVPPMLLKCSVGCDNPHIPFPSKWTGGGEQEDSAPPPLHLPCLSKDWPWNIKICAPIAMCFRNNKSLSRDIPFTRKPRYLEAAHHFLKPLPKASLRAIIFALVSPWLFESCLTLMGALRVSPLFSHFFNRQFLDSPCMLLEAFLVEHASHSCCDLLYGWLWWTIFSVHKTRTYTPTECISYLFILSCSLWMTLRTLSMRAYSLHWSL